MINQSSDFQTTTNSTDSTAYSIEMNASMFTMLTKDVYNDPIKAVIREWSTNAIDACLEANNPIHYQVHLPTLEEPHFSVRDYGTGLAKKDIEGLFSVLGASTKRQSNRFNGTFGIGRMAGLAYSHTFTVESFYNGRHYTYVTTVVDGIPNSVFLDESSTTEPNGLRLSLPVEFSDIDQFVYTARSLYVFFGDKPKLNIEVEINRDSSKDISDTWFFNNTDFYNISRNYVLMSNVMYEIPSNNSLDTKSLSNVVLKVPTGSVSINPGRESISLSKTSVAYLNDRFQEIFDSIIEDFSNLIHAQPTQLEKIKQYYNVILSIPYSIRFDESLCINNFLDDKFHVNSNSYTWGTHFCDNPQFLAAYPDVKVRLKEVYKRRLSDFRDIAKLAKYDTILVIDIKTRFSDIVASFNRAVVLTPSSNKNMDSFLTQVKQLQSDLGIPELVYASDLQEPVEKGPKSDRTGIYICPIEHSRINSSVKEDPTKTYWYIDVTKSSPDMDYADFLELIKLYDLIPSESRHTLVGIQKKYQRLAAKSERYIEAKSAILEQLKSQPFVVYGDNLESLYQYLYPVLDFPRFVDIAPELKEIHPSLKYRNDNPAKHGQSTHCFPAMQELFNTHGIPYTVKDSPYTLEQLKDKYPILDHITNWRLPDDVKNFMIDREIHYQQRIKL